MALTEFHYDVVNDRAAPAEVAPARRVLPPDMRASDLPQFGDLASAMYDGNSATYDHFTRNWLRDLRDHDHCRAWLPR